MSLKLFLIFLILDLSESVDDNLHLKQVIIFSRHNVRETIAKVEEVSRYTPNEWRMLTTKRGYLTQRGTILERYMGEYFSRWFKQEELFDGCPTEDEVYVYANSRNRTVGTAEAFVKSAFENCHIDVKHRDMDTIDPTFEIVPHSTSQSHNNDIIHEMLRKHDELNLTNAFEELNEILNISHSDICRTDSICNLTDIVKTEFVYRTGQELDIIGALGIGNSIVDTFIANYYNGIPLNEIAWGQLNSEKMKLLTEINRQHKNILFNTTESAKDIARPLLNYMSQIFRYNRAKLVLLVGHDVNMIPILNAMGFKSVVFPHQYDVIPIGGKLVFQKWANATNEYLKTELIYHSWPQVRHGIKLYLDNPPQRVLMELNCCKTDQNGFCPWNEFISGLEFD